MKLSKYAAAALAAFVLVAAGAAQSAAPRSITVTGTAILEVESDMATLRLAVVRRAQTPEAARAAASSPASATIAALRKLGIEPKDIRSSAFSISPVYDDRPGKQSVITGYEADAGIIVTIRDTSLVAGAIEASIGAGATEVRDLRYSKTDEESLRLEALRQAAANALAKAQSLATGLGVILGAPIDAQELGVSIRAPEMRSFMAKAAAQDTEPFTPGSIELTATVSVRFAIE